jgi:hypothetical protein
MPMLVYKAYGHRHTSIRANLSPYVMRARVTCLQAVGRQDNMVTFGLKETADMKLHGVYASDINQELMAIVNHAPRHLLVRTA